MAGKSNKEMELAIKIAGKIDKSFNSALATVNKGIKGATKAMIIGSAAAAAAVGAVATKAVSIGSEFESSMSQVAATLQIDKATEAGAAQYAILEEAARQCGRETAFSASQAAEGLNNLAMAGYNATEAAMALPTVLNLAGAGVLEMGDSARYLTAITASLGLDRTEENFNHLADVLALTAAKAKTDVGQIGEAFTTLGGTGRNLKGGVNEIAAALGVLANADITGSEGGTHLRNMILSLQNPRNKDAAEMFNQLGVKAYDAQGKMRGLNEIFGDLSTAMAGMTDEQRSDILTTLFNKTDQAAAIAMLQACGEEYDNLYQAAVNASDGIGAAAEMYKRQNDNLQGDISIFKSAVSEVAISMYKEMEPKLREIVQFGTEIVGVFSEIFKGGSVEDGIGRIIEMVSEKVKELPEGFRQAGVAAAAIAGVNLVGSVMDSKTWQNGVKAVQGFGKAITNTHIKIPKAFNTAGGAVSKFVSGGLGKVKAGWDNVFGDSLLNKGIGKLNELAGKAKGPLGKLGNVVTSVGGKLVGGLTSMMGIAMKLLMPAALIGGLLVALGLLQTQFGDRISGMLAVARERGPAIIQGLVQGITSRIPALLNAGARLVTDLMTTIGTLAPSIIAGGAQIVITLVNGVAQNAPMMISGAVTMIGGFLTGILQALPSLLMAGMNLLLSLVQGIVQNIPVIIQGAITAVMGFAQGIRQNLPTILSLAAQIVITLVSGLASAIPMLFQGAVQIITYLAQGFISNLPLIIQTGVQVIAAIGQGILSALGALFGMVPQVAETIKNGLLETDWLALGGDIINSVISGIGSGAKGVINGIKNLVTGGGGGEEASTPTASAAPAPTMPSTASYTSAGLQGAMAYASGFQSGLPQISSATQGITGLFGEAGTSGGMAFTQSLTGSLGTGFDLATAANIDTGGITETFNVAGLTGGEAFTTALDSGLSGYSFDPSSIGLNMTGFSADLQEAASSGGNAFTTGLDSSLSGYSFDTSSIGIDTGALTSAMTQAGTEGGNAFVTALTQSLGSGFDLASAAKIDTGSITATMTTAGTSGGSAFTSSLSAGLASFTFSPASLGINAGVMQAALRPPGQAGGQALMTALQGAISSASGGVIGAARSLANGVSSAISSGFSRAKSSASSAMSSIRSTCSSGAKSAASAVKNAFEHMSIRIPRPKIPVVHVSSRSATVGTQSVSYPTFSVSYHALGGIFKNATLLQSLRGGNHVVGERGPEAILPLDSLWTNMEQIIRRILQGDDSTVSVLLRRLEGMGQSMSPAPVPVGSSSGGNIYFSPTYNLYGSATREDAVSAGRTTFEEFKKFMAQYEKERLRTKF